MSNPQTAILTRYRAYCNACESKNLHLLSEFWDLPALFTVSTDSETSHTLVTSAKQLIELYTPEFGPASDIDRTVIDEQEVTMYGAGAATVRTALSHFAGERLVDRQFAMYGCRVVRGEWVFVSHLSFVERVVV